MLYGSGTYTYELVDNWLKIPEGEPFIDIGGICIDSEDRVYVLNRSRHPIIVLDRKGNMINQWGEDYFDRAHGICIGPDGSIYCTDDRNHTVSKFTNDGKLILTLGKKNKPSDSGYREVPDLFERISSITKGGPPFNRPTGVALSSSEEIYVADGYGNARIHKFSPDGEFLMSWGEPGPAPGQFRLPHNIWIDKRDRIWVPDRENHRVQAFSANGEFITQWTDLLRPTDLFIDDSDIVYVTELCNRVSIFNSNGRLLARWGNEKHTLDDPLFVAPHAIAVDSRGDLYVGEVAVAYAKVNRGSRTVQKFARKGQSDCAIA